MRWLTVLVLASLSGLGLGAQPSAGRVDPGIPVPVLRPGEGIALAFDSEVHTYGEAQVEAPMGGLAKLVWMRLEGAEWSTQGVVFKCTGGAGTTACGSGKGHGRVGLGRALQEDCDQAFLAWIAASRLQWIQDYGEAVARLRVEEVFNPFLARRLPPGDGLPTFNAPWVGDGDLLRTSPAAFLQWLLEPDKPEVITFGQRFLAGYWVEVKELLGKEDWWFKTATAPVPGDPKATSAWVAGGRGSILVVFHMPRGRGKPEGLARLREILGLKP